MYGGREGFRAGAADEDGSADVHRRDCAAGQASGTDTCSFPGCSHVVSIRFGIVLAALGTRTVRTASAECSRVSGSWESNG